MSARSTLVRASVLCALSAVSIGALSAVVVLIGGLGGELRGALELPLGGWPRTPAAALSIAVHNIQLTLAPIGCAALVGQLSPRLRAFMDTVWAALLTQNAALIGAALAAYGTPLALVLALHLPFELAAVSIAGGVYLSARRQRIAPRTLIFAGAVCGLLLALGALLETYTPLGGQP